MTVAREQLADGGVATVIMSGDLGVGPAGGVELDDLRELVVGDANGHGWTDHDAIHFEPASSSLVAGAVATDELSDRGAGFVVPTSAATCAWPWR